MENSIEIKNPAWFLIVAMLVSAAALFVPVLYFIVPALFAAVLIRSASPRIALPLFAPGLVCVFVFTDLADRTGSSFIPSFSLVIAGILSGIAIWQMHKRKAGGFNSAFASAAVGILGLYCAICLPGILSGAGAFSAAETAFKETETILKQILSASSTPETQPMIDQYLAAFETYSNSIPALIVPGICMVGCASGLSNTLFFRAFIRRDASKLGLPPLTPFRMWQVPSTFTLGLAILLIGSLIIHLTGSEYYTGISSTVSALIAFPMGIQGLCFIDYLIQRSRRNHTVKRVLIYTACAVFLPLLATMLVMAGCFEQVFRIRQKMDLASGSSRNTPFRGDHN